MITWRLRFCKLQSEGRFGLELQLFIDHSLLLFGPLPNQIEQP